MGKQEKNNKRKTFYINDTNELLSLMDLYLSEWFHRDSLLWKQAFTYFFAILVISILPFAKLWGINFDSVIPKWIFPLIGLILSVLFFVFSMGYAERVEAVGAIYRDLINMLPQEYRRKKIIEMGNGPIYKIISLRLSKLIPYVMFVLLIAINIILLCIAIKLECAS
ncbi:MAG: hypothetical protein J1F23_08495 [Oscillospiraceae bacterium]|nr:hypothetical protein [Oscillospiraceae bacterium]